jgi:hypothetical protein
MSFNYFLNMENFRAIILFSSFGKSHPFPANSQCWPSLYFGFTTCTLLILSPSIFFHISKIFDMFTLAGATPVVE